MRAVQVKVQRVGVKPVRVLAGAVAAPASAEYDEITVVIADLHLRCDAVSDRDIRQAKRLADDHGATFMYDDLVADRVRAAIAQIKATAA